MSRDYDEKGMLKSKGIEYFPPVKTIDEAISIQAECGGMILSLEDDGFLVDETLKIHKLYTIPLEQLEDYFRDALKSSSLSSDDIEVIIAQWISEGDIAS
ncbi:MAG: hypothetical protein B6229_05685 [Spirochaetaceae bacterium 4572_7]|nr:MAG: hypothetical protein B6229_05685 [Spirochaetaceae bacterium 4572_7]